MDEGGLGGLREISRESEQGGKCGRRAAREGGWEVSRIPCGLANALDKTDLIERRRCWLAVSDQKISTLSGTPSQVA